MQEGKWIKAEIFTTTAGAEAVGAVLLELGLTGFEVNDPKDLEDFLNHKGAYWDYCDEELLSSRRDETVVTAYLAENTQGKEQLEALKRELERLKAMDTQGEWGDLSHSLSGVLEQDWAFGWKKYYHPVKTGERLVVCPSWESYEAKGDEVVIKLDPGMAFGTGTHESTRLCLGLCEKYIRKGKVLDLGCGSGILAISAVLLGAQSALGVDIDETAVNVANENAAINGVEKKCRFVKDTLGNHINGSYSLVFANIVADVIIEYVHHIISNLGDYAVLIASGIIDEREEDVTKALTAAGLGILERESDGGWVALACRRMKI